MRPPRPAAVMTSATPATRPSSMLVRRGDDSASLRMSPRIAVRFPSTRKRSCSVHVQVAADHEQMSRRAAARIMAAIRRKPALLLGVVTGATPTRAYEHLAARRAEPALFARLRILKLDEWM